jgi:Ca-activated chloride channel family protein
MTFAFPYAAALPLLYLLFRLLRRRGSTGSIAAPSASLLRELPMSMRLRLRTPTLLALEAITVLSLTIGAARPQKITILDQPELGRNIMLAIDVSNSMSGEDFPTALGMTSRMQGVKTVVAEYVRSRSHDRVGLIVFGNTAYLQSPLTNDIKLVESLVQQLQPRMAGDGTAIGDGLGLSLKRLKDIEGTSKAIILITDGVNTAGQVTPLKAAQIAQNLGIQIHTIGIGSGSTPLGGSGLGGIFGTGRQVMAEFDEATLKEIAKMTKGVYFNATSLEGFKEIYRQIDELSQTEEERPAKPIVHELFLQWALIGLAGLILSLAGQATVFRRLP